MAEAQPPAEDAPAVISLRVKTLTGDEHALTVAPDVRASACCTPLSCLETRQRLFVSAGLPHSAWKQDSGCL